MYLPRYALGNGEYTSEKGEFDAYEIEDTYWHGEDDDWNLSEGVFENEHGCQVKPVFISFNDEQCFEAYLFCRVRKLASGKAVDHIIEELNNHLDIYEDDLRLAIAQEWCDQEPWRMFPICMADCRRPVRDMNGEVVAWIAPPMGRQDLKRIMSYMLPKGYDDSLPATHLSDEALDDDSDLDPSDAESESLMDV